MSHEFTISIGLSVNSVDVIDRLESAVARTDDTVRVKNLTMIVSTDHPEDFMRGLFEYFDMADFRWLNIMTN